MTRQQLQRIIRKVAIGYLIIIGIAVILRIVDKTEDQIIYSTLKDLVPLLFAVPLGYLGFCFNSRRAFIETKKKLWNELVDVVNDATHSTYKDTIAEEEYRSILKEFGKAIDQVRASYKNVKRLNNPIDVYPFEPIKEMYSIYRAMGYGNVSEDIKEDTRDQIIGNWQKIRKEFLHEFERYEPEKPVSKYIKKEI